MGDVELNEASVGGVSRLHNFSAGYRDFIPGQV